MGFGLILIGKGAGSVHILTGSITTNKAQDEYDRQITTIKHEASTIGIKVERSIWNFITDFISLRKGKA